MKVSRRKPKHANSWFLTFFRFRALRFSSRDSLPSTSSTSPLVDFLVRLCSIQTPEAFVMESLTTNIKVRSARIS